MDVCVTVCVQVVQSSWLCAVNTIPSVPLWHKKYSTYIQQQGNIILGLILQLAAGRVKSLLGPDKGFTYTQLTGPTTTAPCHLPHARINKTCLSGIIFKGCVCSSKTVI